MYRASSREQDHDFYRQIYATIARVSKKLESKEEDETRKINKKDGVVFANKIGADRMNSAPNNNNAVHSTTTESVSIPRLGGDFAKLGIERKRQKEAARGIKEKVSEMTKTILVISHRRPGAPFPNHGTPAPESAAASRRRVKKMIQQPEQAEAFIRMVLLDDPETGSLELLKMMDFYSIWE